MVFVAVAAGLVMWAAGLPSAKLVLDLPRLEAHDLDPQLVPQTSKIFDARGRLITTFHGAKDRTVVPLDRVSKHLRHAVVAIEDRRFFEHDGIDLRAIARAAVANIREGRVAQGGSTITQQLVKNRLLTRGGKRAERSLSRKIEEAALARQTETRLSKSQILERYLNTVYFGNGAYGAQAAAKTYFDKPAKKLNAREAAMLAGLIKSPDTYDPYDHPKLARKRRNLVIDQMRELGYLTRRRARRAGEGRLGLNHHPATRRYRAPYFVDYVKRLLVFHPRFRFLGSTPARRSKRLFTGGLRVHTTLLPRHQRSAESAISSVLTDKNDPSAALVTIDPRTGAIRAMVGGRDFFAGAKRNPFAKLNLALSGRPGLGRGHNGRRMAPGTGRQAGSAFKPIALAAALENGVKPARRFTAPPCVEFPGASNGKPWRVCNYGGSGYGRVSLREATYKSINVAYAKLGLEIGPRSVTQMARRLGIKAPMKPVNSAPLGTNPVNPLGMAAAYGTIANRGIYHHPVAITKIVNHRGRPIYEESIRPRRRLDPADASTVTQVMKDVIEKGTGTRADIGRPAAGKTGTTQEYRDAWFVGSVPRLTAAVWVGYAQGSIEMKTHCGARPTTECRPTRIDVTGGSWPAEIWQRYMSAALESMPVRDFRPPSGS